MSGAYYNEFDPHKALWIKELIKMGLIADGEVDTRSIVDVKPDELMGFTQCHFFAGIAVWSYALRLAGWEDTRPVWTGSPPCQPFSAAGKQKGVDDSRHLWPVFFGLIKVCRPPVLYCEQVGSAIKHGWLDNLQDDLETEGYASGAVVFPACSVGAPHIRQRLYFVAERVADTKSKRQCPDQPGRDMRDREQLAGAEPWGNRGDDGSDIGLADTTGPRCDRQELGAEGTPRDKARLQLPGEECGGYGLADTSSATSQRDTGSISGAETEVGRAGFPNGDMRLGYPNGGDDGGLADTQSQRSGEGQQDSGGCGEGVLEGKLSERVCCGDDGGLADTRRPCGDRWTHSQGRAETDQGLGVEGGGDNQSRCEFGGMADAADLRSARLSEEQLGNSKGCCGERGAGTEWGTISKSARESDINRLADTDETKSQLTEGPGTVSGEEKGAGPRCEPKRCGEVVGRGQGSGQNNSPWGTVDWLFCRDGKWRPAQSWVGEMAPGTADRLGYRSVAGGYSLSPLQEKAENRVMRLHGYGDAIVAPQAAEFIRVSMEVLGK